MQGTAWMFTCWPLGQRRDREYGACSEYQISAGAPDTPEHAQRRGYYSQRAAATLCAATRLCYFNRVRESSDATL